MRSLKALVLILTLALLVTSSKTTKAQGPYPTEGRSSPIQASSGTGCTPGSFYDPWCDVNHNSAIDTVDIQLVASKWHQSGTYNEPYWNLTGNAGTTPGIHFLGTTDNQALEFHVNSIRALRLEPTTASPNIIGGCSDNNVTTGVTGATIGGGGAASNANRVTDDYSTVGGGVDNQAGNGNGVANDAAYATVSGGRGNTAAAQEATIGGGTHITVTGQAATVAGGSWITATAAYAAVGGGYQNAVAGTYGTISGGTSNVVSSAAATVGGGWDNTASDWYTTVGGGVRNAASGIASTIGGGWLNMASAWYTTVGGGVSNAAYGDYATVGGGYLNRATAITATIGGGAYISVTGQAGTVAGGLRNTVTANGATISGGVDNTARGPYATIPGGVGNTATGVDSFAAGKNATASHDGAFVWSSAESTASWGNNTFTVRAHGGVRFYSASGTATGVQLSPGATAWSSISDRNAKENFADVDKGQLLEALKALPIQTWNLKAQPSTIRHIGPTAQDFNSTFSYLFGKVESPVHINNMDAIGVSLVAAQGLYELTQAQAHRIRVLEAENAAQRQQIDALKARLANLEQAMEERPVQPAHTLSPGWLLAGLGLIGLALRQRWHARSR